MVIEFMGLPGSGKSFLGNRIEEKCAVKGKKCVNVIDRSRTSFCWKTVFKLLHMLLPALPSYRDELNHLCEVATEYLAIQPRYNYDSVQIRNYIGQIVFLKMLYVKLINSKTLYIFDEGIAQQFVNIRVNYNVSEEILRGMYVVLQQELNAFYLMSPLEVVKDSIEKRNRHVCYIDELKGINLDKFLVDYQDACEVIKSIVHPLRLDRETAADGNADIIISRWEG